MNYFFWTTFRTVVCVCWHFFSPIFYSIRVSEGQRGWVVGGVAAPLAGMEGFEPSTIRLTVECSAVELHTKVNKFYLIFYLLVKHLIVVLH